MFFFLFIFISLVLRTPSLHTGEMSALFLVFYLFSLLVAVSFAVCSLSFTSLCCFFSFVIIGHFGLRTFTVYLLRIYSLVCLLVDLYSCCVISGLFILFYNLDAMFVQNV